MGLTRINLQFLVPEDDGMQVKGITEMGDSVIIRIQFRDGIHEKVLVPSDHAIEFLERVEKYNQLIDYMTRRGPR